MRVLVIDGDAALQSLNVCRAQFNRVVDLGMLGQTSRENLERVFHCAITPAPKLHAEDFTKIREIFSAGYGQIVDDHGADWWELASVKLYEQLENVLRLRKIALDIRDEDEVFVSDGTQAKALELWFQRPVHILKSSRKNGGALRRYARALGRLSPRQLLQISADKYDASYRLRSIFARKGKPFTQPVVLLPSAYVNASRTAIRYAEILPHSKFLLIATRSSGRPSVFPGNVRIASLSGYAPGTFSQQECETLLSKWNTLKSAFSKFEEFAVLDRLGVFGFMGKFLQDGLAVRNAWLNVFESERVTAVLCADEANPSTCMPVMIARQRGLPTISCHHGALDGRYRFLRVRSDSFLAKGRMEREYLVNHCGVPAGKIEVGAPRAWVRSHAEMPKRFIIFFSEPYEISGGRCSEVYREVLPALFKIANSSGRELVLKLHPFESRRERMRLANEAIDPEARDCLRVVEGPLSEQMSSQAWCALTVTSSTAVDCALQGIPVFLCKWLDGSQYGYAEQFARFGAGTLLNHPSDLAGIPNLVEGALPARTNDLCHPITQYRLGALLAPHLAVAAAV